MKGRIKISVLLACCAAPLASAAADGVGAPRESVRDEIANPRPVILTGGGGGKSTREGVGRTTDPNIPSSPYAGVASLFIGGKNLATGAAISRRHILTAAHCFDPTNQGVNSAGTDVAVFFNDRGDLSEVVPPSEVESVLFHPGFKGFGTHGVCDDLAIITLKRALPERIPTYALSRSDPRGGEIVRFVGYGESGDGVHAFAAGTGSFVSKRVGMNTADLFFADEHGRTRDGDPIVEVWGFDFDGPNGDGPTGGPTLGDGVEATLGGGDSGGPGFIDEGGLMTLFSVNTFVGGSAPAGTFGSLGGGMVVSGYAEWIDSVIGTPKPAPIAAGSPDRNVDGVVDTADLRMVLMDWGLAAGRGDVNSDGVVSAMDIVSVLRAWTGR